MMFLQKFKEILRKYHFQGERKLLDKNYEQT